MNIHDCQMRAIFLSLKRNAVLSGLFGEREILLRSFQLNVACSMLIDCIKRALIFFGQNIREVFPEIGHMQARVDSNSKCFTFRAIKIMIAFRFSFGYRYINLSSSIVEDNVEHFIKLFSVVILLSFKVLRISVFIPFCTVSFVQFI